MKTEFKLNTRSRGLILTNMVAVCFSAMLAGCASAQTGNLEVRTSQVGYLNAIEARSPGNGLDGQLSYYDMLVQNIGVANKSNEPLELKSIWIEVFQDGDVVQKVTIPADEVIAASNIYTQFAEFGFQTALDVVFGSAKIVMDGEAVSSDMMLDPGEVSVATDSYIITRGAPDSLRVTAAATDSNGVERTASTTLEVRTDLSKNEYIFPLEDGDWYVTGYPGLSGHHRFTQSTEFAIDVTMVDGAGGAHEDDGFQWDEWYSYGKKVLAAADGEVIEVKNRSDHDLPVMMQQEGESDEAYGERISQKQLALFLEENADPAEVAGGNYVRIEHANGEYSHYAHLALGSIKVKVGDKVKQGQHIAGLGGTGEAPYAHLHFQVDADRLDYSGHSVPPNFKNVYLPAGVNLGEESGFWVKVGADE